MQSVSLAWRHQRTIIAANTLSSAEPRFHPDRILSEHDLLLVTHGRWQVSENDQEYDLPAGSLILLSAHRHHRGLRPCTPHTRWIFIHFSAHRSDCWQDSSCLEVNDLDQPKAITVPVFLTIDRNDIIWQLMEEAVRTANASHPLQRLQTEVVLDRILLTMALRSEHQRLITDSRTSENILAVRLYLDEHLPENPSLDDLARRHHLSRRVLVRDFRRLTGSSIKQYQLGRRIDQARSILATDPAIGLKEIAVKLGFTDAFHFSKTFKRLVGVSPCDYREVSI